MFSNNLLMAAAGGGDAGYVIEGSGLFQSANSEYLSWTPSSAGSTTTYTLSCWTKWGVISGGAPILTAFTSSTTYTMFYFDSGTNAFRYKEVDSTNTDGDMHSAHANRDPSAWIHVMLAVDTNAASTNRVRMYVNGEEIDTWTVETIPASADAQRITDACEHRIGRNQTTWYGDLLHAQVCLIDGQQLTPTDFGEFDDQGYWRPIDVTGLTFGTNGFLLEGGTNVANGVDSSITSTTAVTINHEATSTNTANSTTDYTGLFDGIAIGTAAGDRIVQVCVDSSRSSAGARTVSTMTIGGIAAKLIKRSTTANGDALEIWAAEVPTGTTADIDVDMSASMDNMQLNVWSITGADFDSYFTISDTGTTLSQSTLMPLNSAFIGATFNVGNSGCTWTGATEEYDGNIEHGNDASGAYNTSGPNVVTTVTATMASAHAADSMAGVVWFPADGPLNHFTSSGTPTATNDSPTNDADNDYGNYCTWNPLDGSYWGHTYSNGNRTIATTGTNYPYSRATFAVSSGKWYWEVEVDAGTIEGIIGVAGSFATGNTNIIGYAKDSLGYHNDSGNIRTNNSSGAYGDTWATGDTIGVVLDLDADTPAITFYKDNVTQGAYNLPAALIGIPLSPAVQDWSAAGTRTYTGNFGETDLTYSIPSGCSTLMTANMPTPAIPNPDDHIFVGTMSHNGTTGSVTVAFDCTLYDYMVEVKLDGTESWWVGDSIMGITKYFSWDDATTALQTDATFLTSVTSTTFTFGAALASGTYRVIIRKAGLQASRGTQAESGSGDGALMATTYSANQTSGFSIVSCDGFNDTIADGEETLAPHGLGATPDFMQGFNQDTAAGRPALTGTGIGGTMFSASDNYMLMDANSGKSGSLFTGGPANSTNLLLGNEDLTNKADDQFTYYCYVGIEGYSAWGSWTGTANADGPVIIHNAHFKTLMLKNTRAAGGREWIHMNSEGNPYNVATTATSFDTNGEEGDTLVDFDFNSNGLKSRDNDSYANESGEVIIYGLEGGTPIQGPGGGSTSQGRAR